MLCRVSRSPVIRVLQCSLTVRTILLPWSRPPWWTAAGTRPSNSRKVGWCCHLAARLFTSGTLLPGVMSLPKSYHFTHVSRLQLPSNDCNYRSSVKWWGFDPMKSRITSLASQYVRYVFLKLLCQNLKWLMLSNDRFKRPFPCSHPLLFFFLSYIYSTHPRAI